MEENLEQIERLLGLFDQLEAAQRRGIRRIANCINDTLLEAFVDLLGLPDDAVVWDSFEMIEFVLVLKFSITYNPSEPMTPFLQMVSKSTSSEPLTRVHRTLQIGVPLPTVFLPKEEIKGWLMKMATDTFGLPPEVTPPSTEQTTTSAPKELLASPTVFDPNNLTPAQMTQLLYFQQLTKGVKQ